MYYLAALYREMYNHTGVEYYTKMLKNHEFDKPVFQRRLERDFISYDDSMYYNTH